MLIINTSCLAAIPTAQLEEYVNDSRRRTFWLARTELSVRCVTETCKLYGKHLKLTVAYKGRELGVIRISKVKSDQLLHHISKDPSAHLPTVFRKELARRQSTEAAAEKTGQPKI